MKDKHVGVIGTGLMGAPMAANLIKAGYTVSVYNRTRSKAEALIEQGATWCASPADVAADCGIVITIVSDSPDVEAVYLGERGVCAGLQQGTLCIDMSTISPDVARQVADAVREKGSAFLDAPVSGGRNGAEAGKLAIMVGGETNDVERARPVFDVLGKSVVHGGPVGSGQLIKLCNQILCGLNLLAVSEALTFARDVGLDPHTVLKAVSGGAAGSWALDNLGPRMLKRDFEPMFMVDLQQKDLRIVQETARQRPTPLPGTALVAQLLAANQAAREGKEGTQAMIKVIERLGGPSAP